MHNTSGAAGRCFSRRLAAGSKPSEARATDNKHLKDAGMRYEFTAILCATAKPTEVILAEMEQGRGILGVGGEDDIRWRKDFLRKIGYKL